MESPFQVLAEIVRILEQQKINYILVGSLASSMYGIYRSTADIDILADIGAEQVGPLVDAMERDFYVDERAVREALTRRRSFNAIHFDSVFKVDFFTPKSDDFAKKQLERRQRRVVDPQSGQAVYVATAEDTILAKLRWYRMGGESSINQWSDVMGILGASEFDLEFDYLREWADKLGVLDLLEKALTSVRDATDDRGISADGV